MFMTNKAPEIPFYPMSKKPKPDDTDADFSKTVLVFGEDRKFVELGYYDFQEKQWAHFGEGSFLLKCWCYIPDPTLILNGARWKAVKHSGYKESFYSRDK